MIPREDPDDLATRGGYIRLRGDRELTDRWSRACHVLGGVALTARPVSMPPVRIDGKVTRIAGILAGPIEGVGTNMVSSFAWAHLRAHNSPEAVLQAMHRPVLYSHYVNLGFGTVLAPRVVVGDNGYPSVIAHLYTISLSGAEWSYGVADADNYTIRNIVLRIVAQVAGATQRAHPVGNDVAYHVSKL